MAAKLLGAEIRQTIEHLTVRWADADRKTLKHVFPLLSQGRPVSRESLAVASGRTAEAIERALSYRRVELDGEGRAVELFGVGLQPTHHHIETESAGLFSCCALVAHVVPRLLNQTVRLTSKDPISHTQCRLRVSPIGIETAEPDGVVATMIVTDASKLEQDAPRHFCNHVRHCASIESASAFAAGDSRRYTIELEELDAAAAAVYRAIWL